jgi:hypothetical protein
LACHGGDEEADCACSYDEGGGAGGGRGAIDRVYSNGEGFEEGCCIEGDVVWYPECSNISCNSSSVVKEVGDVLVAPNCRMVDPFLQSSLEMRDTLCTAPKPHLLTEVIPPFPADSALSTGNSYFECNAIADSEAIDSWANAYYDTRRFMTER